MGRSLYDGICPVTIYKFAIKIYVTLILSLIEVRRKFTNRKPKHDTPYLMTIVIRLFLSLTSYEIFAIQVECQQFDLEMKVTVKEDENRNCTN